MNRTLQGLYLGLIAVFLWGPLFVVAAVSLNERKLMHFPPSTLSLKWYEFLFTDYQWSTAFEHSLLIAVFASLFAVSVAFPLAYTIWRYQLLFARLLGALAVVPFILPFVVTSVCFLLFWAWLDHAGRIENIIISHGILLTTVPLLTISLGLNSIDRAAIEAAQSMGANERTLLRTIVLPLIRPYIISGYAFVFVLSLNEYIVAFMVAGYTVETLPIRIFNSMRGGFTPVMSVGTVLFMLISAVVFGLLARFGNLPKMLGAEAPERR